MEKLLLMQTAAMLAVGVTTRLPQLAAADQPKDNQPLQAENLAEWEIFRIFYSALVQAVADEADWPSPQVPPGAIQSLIGKIPGLGGIVGGTPQAPAPAPAPVPMTPVAAPTAAPTGSPATQSMVKKQ